MAVGSCGPMVSDQLDGVASLARTPMTRGRIWLPGPGVLVLAIIGATFLLVVAVYRWPVPRMSCRTTSGRGA